MTEITISVRDTENNIPWDYAWKTITSDYMPMPIPKVGEYIIIERRTYVVISVNHEYSDNIDVNIRVRRLAK